jgi:hypothetical protein
MNPKYKMFISKNSNSIYWVKENDIDVEKPISSNLRFYFYDIKETQNLIFIIDGVIFERDIKENKIFEFDLDSNQVKNVKLIDNNGEYDYSTVYKEINRNLIYLGH